MQGRTRCIRAIALSTLVLAGCSEHQVVPPPAVKFNTAPKELYEITIKLSDAPGDVRTVDGNVQFGIGNERCVPTDHARAVGGLKLYFDEFSKINFKKQGEDRYVGHMYADRFLPEDYYGLGVCHWKVVAVNARIDTGGTVQQATLRGESLSAEKKQRNLCRRSAYSQKTSLNLCFTRDGDRSTNSETERNYTAVLGSRRINK